VTMAAGRKRRDFPRRWSDVSAVLVSASDRFWSKVRTGTEADCWEWTAGLYGGKRYGSFRVSKELGNHLAHRVAFGLSNGGIPDGMDILHRCDNPRCCNPKHLFAGTAKDNVDDMMAKGRWANQTHVGGKSERRHRETLAGGNNR
jgi:hypothetical protein